MSSAAQELELQKAEQLKFVEDVLAKEGEFCFGPMYVSGIDPGFANLGHASTCMFGRQDKGEEDIRIFIDPSKLRTANLGIDMNSSNVDAIDRAASSFFHTTFKPETITRSYWVVEEQYYNPRAKFAFAGHKLQLLNQALFTILKARYNAPVSNVSSNGVKTAQGLKNDTANKSKLMSYVARLLGDKEMQKLGRPLTTHEADALALVHYYVMNHFKDKNYKYEIAFPETLTKLAELYHKSSMQPADSNVKIQWAELA